MTWRLTVAAVMLATALGGMSSVTPEAAAEAGGEARPNVLLIITDDQRAAGTMAVMPKTLKWFAEQGVTFPNAFATTPTCCPSRASIFTGRYAHNHGVHTSEEGQADNLDHSTTLQYHLAAAGYRNAIFGKFLNEWDLEKAPPYFHEHAIFSDAPRRGYKDGRWRVNGVIKRIGRYSTTYVQEKAMNFITDAEARDNEPWMLVLTPWAPHPPAVPAHKYADTAVPPFIPDEAWFEEDVSDKPPGVALSRLGPDRALDLRKRQLQTLRSVDDMVHSVMRTLTRTGEASNTIAFFMSDNGFQWGEHRLLGKREPYRHSVQIPLYLRWGENVAQGSVDDRLVANLDVAPTVYQVAGLTPDVQPDGHSLLGNHVRDRLLLEHWERGERHTPTWGATWTEQYQYIEHYAVEHLVPEFVEFYDLLQDPAQINNLLADSDAGNDPWVPSLTAQLRDDFSCSGTSGERACP